MANDPARQHELLQNIGSVLLEAAGENWTKIYLKHSGTRSITTHNFLITTSEGEEYQGDLPSKCGYFIHELRSEMYREDLGTWFSMTYTITPPGNFSVDYDYDSKPEFPFELDPVTYYNDLNQFPRSPEHIPDWLREALAEAEEIIAQREQEQNNSSHPHAPTKIPHSQTPDPLNKEKTEDIPPGPAYRRAQEHLAADAETTHPETRQAWEQALEVYYNRTLHTVRAIGHDVEYRPADERLDLTRTSPPHAQTLPHDWLKAFYLSLVLRDRRCAHTLSNINAGVITHVSLGGTPSASIRSRQWIEALQAYYMDGFTFSTCLHMATTREETDDFLQQQDAGGMLEPTMHTLDAVDSYDPEEFEEYLLQALERFRTHLENNPSWERYPLALLALTCSAHDRSLEDPEFDWNVTSDLLPRGIVHNTWTSYAP